MAPCLFAASCLFSCSEGVDPILIHTTFQRYATPGRIARLREFGMWYMDPPEYYGVNSTTGKPTGRKLLTYENDVLEFVAAVKQRRSSENITWFEQNWLGMSYQLAAFRFVQQLLVSWEAAAPWLQYACVAGGLGLAGRARQGHHQATR